MHDNENALPPDDNENDPSDPEKRCEETVRRPTEGAKLYEATDHRWQLGTHRPGLPCPEIEAWQIEDALRGTGGHIKASAHALGISRWSLWRRMKAEPHLRDILTEVLEETKDDVEAKLIERAKAGEPWAVRFFLSRQARDRGYGNV